MGKGRLRSALGIPGQMASPAALPTCQGLAAAPHPAFPVEPSRWLQPWAPEALGRGGRSWGTRVPGSLRTLDWPSYFPTPLWSSHRPKLWLRANLAPKKQEENLKLESGWESGGRKEKEVHGRGGWPGGGRWGAAGGAPGLSITPGRRTSQPGPHPPAPQAAVPGETQPGPSRAPWQSLEVGALEPGRGGSVCLCLRPISIFSAANPGSACCPPH